MSSDWKKRTTFVFGNVDPDKPFSNVFISEHCYKIRIHQSAVDAKCGLRLQGSYIAWEESIVCFLLALLTGEWVLHS